MHWKRKLLITALLICLERSHNYITHGFSTAKVKSELSSDPQWCVNAAKIDIAPFLNQRFSFLGSGGTCYAFLGEDKETILKLFKHHHLFPNSFLRYLKLPGAADLFRIDQMIKKEERHAHKRLPFLFTSCKIAYEKLKEETGLIYLTLQKNAYNREVILIDALGFKHCLDLSHTEFALQKRAIPLLPYLSELIMEGKIDQGKKIIDALIELIQARAGKGIADRDPNLLLNFGVVDDRVIEVDIGSFSVNEHLKSHFAAKRELFLVTQPLNRWLKSLHPELCAYLDAQINSCIKK